MPGVLNKKSRGKGGLPDAPEACGLLWPLPPPAQLIRALEIVKDLPLRVPP
ncbi:hypothetical protein D3C74_91420 [compost metagenome]